MSWAGATGLVVVGLTCRVRVWALRKTRTKGRVRARVRVRVRAPHKTVAVADAYLIPSLSLLLLSIP